MSCSAFMIAVMAQTAIADAIPDYISAAVAGPNRADADRQHDAARKPAEVITFAGLKPGDKVADFLPAGGYFTKILCAVVGDSGHVYAISVPPAAKSALTDKPAAESPGEACTNVTASTLRSKNYPAPELYSASDDPGAVYEYWASRLPAESFVAPEPLDMIWIAQNYHALHNKEFGSPNMPLVDTALLTGLKPGGILIIEDYAAKAGSGVRDTNTLHRIEPEQVKKEVIAAGFVFVGESNVLRYADDPHTTNAYEMDDRADRFVLKFRKP